MKIERILYYKKELFHPSFTQFKNSDDEKLIKIFDLKNSCSMILYINITPYRYKWIFNFKFIIHNFYIKMYACYISQQAHMIEKYCTFYSIVSLNQYSDLCCRNATSASNQNEDTLRRVSSETDALRKQIAQLKRINDNALAENRCVSLL